MDKSPDRFNCRIGEKPWKKNNAFHTTGRTYQSYLESMLPTSWGSYNPGPLHIHPLGSYSYIRNSFIAFFDHTETSPLGQHTLYRQHNSFRQHHLISTAHRITGPHVPHRIHDALLTNISFTSCSRTRYSTALSPGSWPKGVTSREEMALAESRSTEKSSPTKTSYGKTYGVCISQPSSL